VKARKEEQRIQELRMKSRQTPMTTSVGVGDFRVDEPVQNGTDFAANIQVVRKVNLDRKLCDIGVGDSNVWDTETVGGGPVRIHEREVSTEQNTELKEKEIKTVFLSGAATRDAIAGAAAAAKPKQTRSIGVGDSKVFDVTETDTSLQVKRIIFSSLFYSNARPSLCTLKTLYSLLLSS